MTGNGNLAAHHGARLSGGQGFTGGNGVTLFPIPFTTIDYDDDRYVVGLTGFRIPTGLPGRYRIRAAIAIQAINNASRWHAELILAAGAGQVLSELHVAAGLVGDAISEQTIVAEGVFELLEGDSVQAALTGTYFPAVVADFIRDANAGAGAFELTYLGR